MIHLRKKLTFVAGMLAAAGASTGLLLACSDDSAVTTDGGVSEGGIVEGGGGDTSTPDGDTDTGTKDAGPDVVVVEAGTLAEFITQNAKATCARYKDCCAPGAGAAFDVAKCEADFAAFGWNQSLATVTTAGVADGGNLAFDPAAASQCLTAVRNMTCKNTPAAEYKNAWQKCLAAVKGTVAIGGACKSNVECATTAWCDPDNNGGTCTALKANGDACQVRGLGGVECSYRSAGNSQCLDPNATGTSTCQAPLANGEDCSFDWDCQSGACNVVNNGAAFQCDDEVDFLYGICEAYGPDAGP